MEFLPGSIGIAGSTDEQTAAGEILGAFSQVAGQMGFRLPSVGVRGNDDIPSFVTILDGKCVVLIDIVARALESIDGSGDVWTYKDGSTGNSKDVMLDKFEIEIINRLKDDSRLYNRRKNSVNVPIVKLLFFSKNTPEELAVFEAAELIVNPAFQFKELVATMKAEITDHSFAADLNDRVYSLMEGTKAFERSSINSAPELRTISDFANHSLKSTFRLDDEQRKVSMQLPQGPQRIRGLAGTGKTVILALKAALTHKDLPKFKILFVFNTQSMYNQIRSLVSKYYIYETREEPNWANLQILHAWGGSRKEGFYSKTCKQLGIVPFNFMDVRKYNDPYEYIFKDLLEKVKTYAVPPIYDMVLIDEAQDFPQPFF